MPLKKKYLKSKPVVKVTFEVEKEAAQAAEQIFLLAEFNDWEPLELKKFKNGKFKLEASVPCDQQETYQFKYKLLMADGAEVYDNDWAADGYIPSDAGSDNSVLHVSQ